MVLAAGRGERMRPLSDVLPKPALPLIEQPVIASGLKLAASAGAERIVLNTWHLADEMEAALADVEIGHETVISREEELMGTAGGIALARDRGLLGERGEILLVNGDGLLNLDLQPLFERMRKSDDLVTLALLPHLDPLRWSRVQLDESGAVSRIARPGAPETGEAPFLYPGVMLLSRTALNVLPNGRGEIPERLWRPALAGKRLGGVVVSGHWREVGTPADYLEAALGRLDGRTVIHPNAVIDRSATVESALIGRDARIGPGAVVDESVVTWGARVARQSRIRRSVLLGPIETTPGEIIANEFRAGRR